MNPLLKDTSVPVVVIKSYHHGSLGIARSLGRLGVPVFGIDTNRKSVGLSSRYFRGKYVCKIDDSTPEETVKCLIKVAKNIGRRSILISTYDEGSEIIAEFAETLNEHYIFPQNSLKLVQRLTSKKGMYFLAKENNVPTAQTYFPKSADDVEKYLEGATFPIMLKGIYGQICQARSGRKMFVANNKTELMNFYKKYEDPANPNLMLQEYLPGEDDSIWMFNGYFNDKSDCLFAITGKKIRQTPPHVGMTSLGVCLRNQTVADMTIRFMKNIGYKGILDIGYRFDRRDGKYKVLDINPRIGCTFRLFVADNGLDVARVGYMDLTGQTVPASHIVEERRWLLEDSDLFSSIQYYLEKKLTLRHWATSFRGVKETAWFALDDLYPFVNMCAKSSLNAIHQVGKIASMQRNDSR
jgi:D-aspartate ligase